jgi:hypothetical protein
MASSRPKPFFRRREGSRVHQGIDGDGDSHTPFVILRVLCGESPPPPTQTCRTCARSCLNLVIPPMASSRPKPFFRRREESRVQQGIDGDGDSHTPFVILRALCGECLPPPNQTCRTCPRWCLHLLYPPMASSRPKPFFRRREGSRVHQGIDGDSPRKNPQPFLRDTSCPLW